MGELRNPEGRNQTTRQREAWQIALALARASFAEPDQERRVELLREFARYCIDAGVAGHPQVVTYLVCYLWPLPQ